jgi:hypothetical protein
MDPVQVLLLRTASSITPPGNTDVDFEYPASKAESACEPGSALAGVTLNPVTHSIASAIAMIWRLNNTLKRYLGFLASG